LLSSVCCLPPLSQSNCAVDASTDADQEPSRVSHSAAHPPSRHLSAAPVPSQVRLQDGARRSETASLGLEEWPQAGREGSGHLSSIHAFLRLTAFSLPSPAHGAATTMPCHCCVCCPAWLPCRQRHRTAGLEGSWVAICVVGEKSKPRETAAGG
jgi:hypothetical protein